MGEVILGPCHTANNDRKYHRPSCRFATDDPRPWDLFDENDDRIREWADPCKECFGDSSGGDASA